MFFGMASLYAYAFYAESLKVSRYLICLILFALALISKSMLVTLPFVFLLLDYWPLSRWQKALKDIDPLIEEDKISPPFKSRGHLIGRLLWEKVPFIFLTIFSSIITFFVQYKADSVYPFFIVRVYSTIIAYAAYLKKTFWPVDLTLNYFFVYSFPPWQIIISCFVLSGITKNYLFYSWAGFGI
jgi:hypothetical protein